jgi:hypothetical protein
MRLVDKGEECVAALTCGSQRSRSSSRGTTRKTTCSTGHCFRSSCSSLCNCGRCMPGSTGTCSCHPATPYSAGSCVHRAWTHPINTAQSKCQQVPAFHLSKREREREVERERGKGSRRLTTRKRKGRPLLSRTGCILHCSTRSTCLSATPDLRTVKQGTQVKCQLEDSCESPLLKHTINHHTSLENSDNRVVAGRQVPDTQAACERTRNGGFDYHPSVVRFPSDPISE